MSSVLNQMNSLPTLSLLSIPRDSNSVKYFFAVVCVHFLISIRSSVKNSKILTGTKGFVKKYNLHYKRGLPVSLVENFSQKETKKLYFRIFPNKFFGYPFVNQHINIRMRFLLITFSGKTWRKSKLII